MSFCYKTAIIWQVVGYVFLIAKIVIPIILIILGIVDIGKAVISSDDKAISKAVGQLVRRFIAAIAIFFIPTIVSAIFSAVKIVNTEDSDYQICVQCLTNVTGQTEGYCESSISVK